MRGWIYVHTAEEYKKWAAENLTASAAAAPAAEEKKDEAKPATPAAPQTGGKAKR
jgi:heme/copper-type cytochrome/quinol oxidase subunit 2